MKQGNYSKAVKQSPQTDGGKTDAVGQPQQAETGNTTYRISNEHPIRLHEEDVDCVVMLGYD